MLPEGPGCSARLRSCSCSSGMTGASGTSMDRALGLAESLEHRLRVAMSSEAMRLRPSAERTQMACGLEQEEGITTPRAFMSEPSSP